jgi:hypothetical protein
MVGRAAFVFPMADRTSAPRAGRRASLMGAALGGLLAGVAVVVAVAVASTGARSAPPLVFGIYPGGGVGTVAPRGALRPEDPALRLAALERLKPRGGPFVARLYTAYDGRPAAQSLDADLLAQIGQYGAAGMRIELVLTYRPQGLDAAAAVDGYVRYVRDVVRRLGPDRHLVSLQITNEVNLGGGLDASDGRFPGARDALVRGVIAAHDEARKRRFSQLRVGFSWAYERGHAADAFWHTVGRAGGRRFAAAVDWVGLDIYPGTWGPALGTGDLGGAVHAQMRQALGDLSRVHLGQAGIGDRTALRVSESGYPTGPGRSDADQALVAAAMVGAVDEVRGAYHVTDFRWFDLRDADSSVANVESSYGLLRDDYTPKAAFEVYRALVARRSAPAR